MRTETARRGSAPARPPRNTRRGRTRDADAPASRGKRVATTQALEPEAPRPTMLQLATPKEMTPKEMSREPVAPVYTRRELFEAHVRAQVVLRLSDHDVSRFPIHVAIEGARVEIHGVVPDALTSQLAEDLVWSVPAVRQCENRLRVG